MDFRAEARFVRVSPQKARLVLNTIKGRRVEDALTTLTFLKKGIAPMVLKTLRSAVENANYLSTEKGLDVELDNLFVKDAVANEGPRMKRIRPAPMGRAFRYQRRLTHIILSVAERGAKAGLVTKVEEPKPEVKATKATVEKSKPAAKKAGVSAKKAAVVAKKKASKKA